MWDIITKLLYFPELNDIRFRSQELDYPKQFQVSIILSERIRFG